MTDLGIVFKNVSWKAFLLSVIAFQQSVFSQDRENKVEREIIAYSNIISNRPSSSPSHQDTSDQKNIPPQTNLIQLNSRLQIGANYTYVAFKPQGKQSFEGNLGGLQALYEYKPMNNFYGGAKFAWRQGTMHRHSASRTFTNYEAQERLGYTFANDAWDLTLFSGFGYHYLKQKLSPKTGGSLRFTYNEFYVPLGWLTNYCVNSWFKIGLDFTWMPQVFSSVSIVPLGGARWTLKNAINNYYVSIPHTFTLTENKRFQIIVNPFYEHWEDGHSTAKLSNGVSLGLPKNRYNFYGVDVNFAYCF